MFRTMHVAVIGTGYVGLVSGSCLAELGHQVTCVDTDLNKVTRLQSGEIPIFEPGLEELVKRNVHAGRLHFTGSYADAVPGADVVSIAVGTPSSADGSADLTFVYTAASAIAEHLSGYTVIADKSTVPVGTAEEVEKIIREKYQGTYDVVSNPEILREGHAVQDFLHPTRIIIGSSSQQATDVILQLYTFLDCQKIVMSPRSAELTKYAANAFLATKISFINEIAHLAEEVGADIDEVAQGIGSDPRIGREFLRAGLGWGGSCFPKDVLAIRHLARKYQQQMPIVSAACTMNERSRSRVMERLEKQMGVLEGKNIGLLGLSFKNNTDDTRESAALELLKLFVSRRAQVRAYDPEAHVHQTDLLPLFTRLDDPYAVVKDADAVVIATEWDEFRTLDLDRMKREMRGSILVDGRNLFNPSLVRAAGFMYIGIGRN